MIGQDICSGMPAESNFNTPFFVLSKLPFTLVIESCTDGSIEYSDV